MRSFIVRTAGRQRQKLRCW